MSQSSLAISIFFHILATVIWIGGLVITVLLVWPEMNRALAEAPGLYRLLTRLRNRFKMLSNISLAVLVVTGLFQMTADPHYNGFMAFDNDWSRIILFKHIAILVMIASGVVLQYSVAPALERTSLLRERGKGDAESWQKLRRREIRLTWLNVVLGIVVLGCSAWATTL